MALRRLNDKTAICSGCFAVAMRRRWWRCCLSLVYQYKQEIAVVAVEIAASSIASRSSSAAASAVDIEAGLSWDSRLVRLGPIRSRRFRLCLIDFCVSNQFSMKKKRSI